MREIVLDTETTGLDPETGDRLVEIGAVELYGHMPTGKTYHQYINPERDVPKEAVDVHGLTYDFLRDKPLFKEVAADFLAFIGDAKLVIHNAAFDMKFLNAELKWLGMTQLPFERAIDTLNIARKKFPGSPASRDALCRRYGIDNSARTLHGALLDSEILADVYLELVGGRQPDLVLTRSQEKTAIDGKPKTWRAYPRPNELPSRLTDEEATAHAAFVDGIDNALWKRAAAD